jgi:hypothetical protein
MPKQAPLCDICWAVMPKTVPPLRGSQSRVCCRCLGHTEKDCAAKAATK